MTIHWFRHILTAATAASLTCIALGIIRGNMLGMTLGFIGLGIAVLLLASWREQ